jgi:hypothetical protein
LKPERGGFEKRRKKGGFEKIYQFEKTVVSFENVSQNNLTTNNNVYRL